MYTHIWKQIRKKTASFPGNPGTHLYDKNLEAVKADMLDSLEEMNIDGAQFYRQHLSYLENYVQVFEESYSLTEEESFFFGRDQNFF